MTWPDRVGLRLAARGALLWVAVACGDLRDEKELDFSGREYELCEDCDECTTMVSTCVCKTCTDLAVDEDGRTLLVCDDGMWKASEYCPGGASVACDGHGYRLSCVDETGSDRYE